MNIATLENDASIEALAERLYGAGAKQRPEIAERLLELNPHLHNVKDLPPGTPVVIPAQAADEESNDPLPGVDPRQGQAAVALAAALDALQQRRLEQLERRREAFENVGKLASSDAIRKAAGPELATRLDETVEAANRGIVETDALKAVFLEELKRARPNLRPPRRRSA
jgi:hypothetical protein